MVQDAWANQGKILNLIMIQDNADADLFWEIFQQGDNLDLVLTVTYTPPAAANIKKISGETWDTDVKKVAGVAEASCKKVAGISAN